MSQLNVPQSSTESPIESTIKLQTQSQSQHYIWYGPKNYEGVNPPKNAIVPINLYQNTIYSSVPGIGTTFDKDLIYINSREPYAVEFMKTKYGPLSTVLGTSLGTKKD